MSLFKLEAGIDTGNVLGQRRVDVRPGDTFESLYRRVAPLAIPLVGELITAVIADGTLPTGKAQDESSAFVVAKPSLAQRAVGRLAQVARR